MTKILLTGISGFIGRNLATHLLSAGYQVEGCDFVRNDSLLTSVGFISLDIRDRTSLGRWVDTHAPDIIIHLGARTDLLGRSLADYDSNTSGVDNLIAVCKNIQGLRRVIFASSRMVCRIDHVPGGYEDYCPPNAYGASKVEGERIVRASDLKCEWTIVRPTSIWGPGFGIPYRNFFDQVWRRRYFHQRGFNPRKSFGYVGNTVWQLAKLIDAPGVHGRTFYLGDYEPLRMVEWADYIHQRFGLPGRIPTVSMPWLRVAAKAGDLMNAVLKKDKAPLTTFRLKNLTTDMVYPQLDELAKVTGPLPWGWQAGTDETVRWMQAERQQKLTTSSHR